MHAIKPTHLVGACALALGLASAASAQADDCLSVSSGTSDGRTLKQSICAYAPAVEEFDGEFVPERVMLKLPNLTVSAIDHMPTQSDRVHELAVEIRNTSAHASPKSNAQVLVQSPLGTTLQTYVVPALTPGQRHRIDLDALYIGYTAEPAMIEVVAIVDPFSAAKPMGDLWESDENDNVRTRSIVAFQGF
ncbi:MAG: hypothetical protein AAF918_07230 [Pseudomonadota bacterium]